MIYLLDKVYFTYKTAISIKVEGNRGGCPWETHDFPQVAETFKPNNYLYSKYEKLVNLDRL